MSFLSEQRQKELENMRIQKGYQDLEEYKRFLKDEGKYKTPFETVKGLFGLKNGGQPKHSLDTWVLTGKLTKYFKWQVQLHLVVFSKNSSANGYQYNRKNDAWELYITNMDAVLLTW